MFNYLKQLWTFIESIPNSVKTIIIIVLLGVILCYGIVNRFETRIRDIIQKNPIEMQEEEKYTIEM